MSDFMSVTVEMYSDWVNNFLTVERFAEHYDLTVEEARRGIKFWRIASHVPVRMTKGQH